MSEDDRLKQLEDQKKNNVYHDLVEGNLIIKQGLIEKRKVCINVSGLYLQQKGHNSIM